MTAWWRLTLLWLLLVQWAFADTSPAQQLALAIAAGKRDQVVSLSQSSPELLKAALGKRGTTALAMAVSTGRVGVVEALLDCGADPNFGKTPPLTLALTLGRLDIVELLLKRGADANRLDSKGRPPLFYAVTLVSTQGDAAAAKACALLMGKNARSDQKVKIGEQTQSLAELAGLLKATRCLQVLQGGSP